MHPFFFLIAGVCQVVNVANLLSIKGLKCLFYKKKAKYYINYI